MKRLIALRQRYKAFGRGTLELLRPDNRKVFAFLRRYGDEQVLVVVNLSRFAQCVELDLSKFRGAIPVELFGNRPFPPDRRPAVLHHARAARLLLVLPRAGATRVRRRPCPAFSVAGEWDDALHRTAGRQFQSFLPRYIADRRWFAQKTRNITAATVARGHPRCRVPGAATHPRWPSFVIVRVELDFGEPEHYVLPLAFATGAEADELRRWHPRRSWPTCRPADIDGVLFDAIYEPDVHQDDGRGRWRAAARWRGPGRLARAAHLRSGAWSARWAPTR